MLKHLNSQHKSQYHIYHGDLCQHQRSYAANGIQWATKISDERKCMWTSSKNRTDHV